MENKPIHKRVEDIEAGHKLILAKLEEVLAKIGNPTISETLQDPEVLKLQESIQTAIKNKQKEELQKTLADLTGVNPIIEAEVKSVE